MNSLTEKIEKWLTGNSQFGLKLQTGWFGRPFDNNHSVSHIIERPNKLIVEIDEQLYLVFTKPLKIETDGADLEFSEYSQLSFDYQGYGDMHPHCSLYGQPGVTTFISYAETGSSSGAK